MTESFKPARRLAAASLLVCGGVSATLPASAAEPIWTAMCERMTLAGQDQPQVHKWAGYYEKHPQRVRRLLAPSEPWLWHIVAAIEERGFPMEIALLPVIESNYNPHARSPGGAVGIWQFVGVTARNFGLAETEWYDGRRDPLASTAAALDYLERLHDQFDNWLLALAAYNVGENRVIAEVRRQVATAGSRDFWRMPLPEETRGHVPRLLGLAAAVCSSDMPLPPIEDLATTEVVELPGPIDLELASQWSGVPVSTLLALNPGLRAGVTDPQGPHRLLLPVGRSRSLRLAVARVDPSELVRYDRHTVIAGDTLSQIALRYGTTVAAIRSANRLEGSLIKVGHTLMVPRTGLVQAAAKAPLIGPDDASGRHRTEYVVRAGDSLWRLARRFGVSQKELQSWNDLPREGLLRVGRKLVIWLPPETKPDA